MQQHFSAVNFNVIQFKRKTKIYIQNLFLLFIENRTLKLTYSLYVGTENIRITLKKNKCQFQKYVNTVIRYCQKIYIDFKIRDMPKNMQ